MLVDRFTAARKKEFPNQGQNPELVSSSFVMFTSTFIGFLLLASVYFFHAKYASLIMIFVGCFGLFISNSSIAVGIMYSVSIENRAFAIAFSNILCHILGDVPSPLIAGYLKDTLAPGCIGDDDNINTSM